MSEMGRNDEIIKKIYDCQLEYEDFRKRINGSFRYLDKVYERILTHKRVFEKSLDTLGFVVFENQDKDDVKEWFLSTYDEISKFIWCMHEYRECVNNAVANGVNFESKFLKECLDDSESDVIECMNGQRLNNFKEMEKRIKEYSDCVNRQYIKTDIAMLGFSNQFEKLKSRKEYLAPFYKRIMDRTFGVLMASLCDDYMKEYSKYHCQDVNDFVKKITEFVRKLEGE